MHDDSPILSVSALTQFIKGNLEGAFPFVWVRGQVTNLSRPSSGHVYFALRDDESSIAAVWFKGNQKEGEAFDPLTGEVYEEGPRISLAHTLENGQELICAGRLTVYAQRGQYQLVVELGQEVGLGKLYAEFERLREKLGVAGYFAQERKRVLPECPRRVAVITAVQGDAVHDFLRRADERGFGTQIRIYSSLVQGDAAPQQICERIATVNAEGWAEVVVLIRGGGSVEDLWAFNSEAVAQAIFSSKIPVVAGIGHEADFSLADMTADVRAATPTHAGILLWPTREELFARLIVQREALERAGMRVLEGKTAAFGYVSRELFWRSPQRVLERWQERLAVAVGRLHSTGLRGVERKTAQLLALQGAVLRIPEKLPQYAGVLDGLNRRLCHAREQIFSATTHAFERMVLRLEAVNPHAPLERGYALVRKSDGSFVRRTDMAQVGEVLRVVVQNGEIPVRVEGENG